MEKLLGNLYYTTIAQSFEYLELWDKLILAKNKSNKFANQHKAS